MPATPSMVMGFIAYLSDNGRAGVTITSYISAVAYFHKIQGHADPTASFLVRKLLAGARVLSKTADVRLPITTSILNKLCGALSTVVTDSYKFKMIKAMFLLAFHGLLRIGEFTVKNNEQNHTLQMADIHFGHKQISKVCSYVIITFRSFKHSKGHPVMLKIQASSGHCPVSSLQTYVCVRPSVHGPLFVFADKSAVSASYFSDVLRRCVQAAGLPINSYKPHSFRIGGATMAAQKGYTAVQIAEMGRWKSSAFKKYIRIPCLCV